MTDLQTTTPARRPRIAFRWPDVLRVLQSDAERSAVVSALRTSGFSADSFASQRRAREVVADALGRIEGDLELDAIDAGARGQRRERLNERRLAVQALRRRLELELWP